jgi:NAD(P)-dependent dehydrogenase (short-subunit alcohol dehydrogenase family)
MSRWGGARHESGSASFGIIHATRAVIGSMRAQHYGRIVNVASIAGIGTALSGNAFYAATKAEVLILTRRFALELIKREEALLLSQAGRLDESFSALQSIRDVAARAPRYDRAEYLPRTPERLQRLANIVASRDVFVLLQGPSFATFAARLHECPRGRQSRHRRPPPHGGHADTRL